MSVTVNGFDLFPLMVISLTVNLNHTALPKESHDPTRPDRYWV